MKKIYLLLLLCSLTCLSQAQKLTIEKIMQEPKHSVGALPSNVFWSEDSKTIYFNWNPDKNKADSLFSIAISDKKIIKVPLAVRQQLPAPFGVYSKSKRQKLYTKNGDIFLLDTQSGAVRQLTNTLETEDNPTFSGKEDKVIFTKNNNLYSLDLTQGNLSQLTQLIAGSKKPETKPNEQDKWLKQDQLAMFDILKERADKKKEAEKNAKGELPKRPKEFYTDDKRVDNLSLSPDGRFATFRLVKAPVGSKNTIVPNYVTESGFTEDIPARTKVGAAQASYEFWVYQIEKDTLIQLATKGLEGITTLPKYLQEYKKDTAKAKKPEAKAVVVNGPLWSEDANYAVLVVRSLDNKDRWLVSLNPNTMQVQLLDHQHDEAWIGGPNIGFTLSMGTMGFLGDNKTLYFQSEADGYSHIYTVDLASLQKKQLTKGKYEVQSLQLSNDKQSFYLTTNEVHPGEQHFYKMSVQGGEKERLTSLEGANQVVLSPDEKQLAFLYSSPTQPWELYGQANQAGAKAVQLTQSQSEAFKAYRWRNPQVITIKARDGEPIYARLYEGKGAKGKKPAVIFVHGAGYLQNAHKWWSQYFREYMFHNFLVDQGYTVLDIDYRGSAGYGRDWRTGIYRFMGGKDLDDHVDAAQWLVKNQGVDAKRIGMYGGSYGGFMTLMALFTSPDTFKAGAALRPVTDWAAYNHPYTANILNEPQKDSLAYRRSSPIYHAEGLKNRLLICHGMVDVNVHFQDVVRLSQRLIELKKENWELAAYPMEDHGFVEPTSWMDEYKRIFKLFEEALK